MAMLVYFSAICDITSTKNESKDVEIGQEVVEETYRPNIHHSLSPTVIVSDALRCLPGNKTVAASIAAAQAVLTNTLSPTSHRKIKKSAAMTLTSNGTPAETVTSQPEISHYSLSKELEQIKSSSKKKSL